MKEDKIEVSRLIALSKKPFPRIGKDFYRKLRRRIQEIDEALGDIEYEEEGRELRKERENLLNYGERIYRKRMRTLLVELSKKVSGGKVNITEFTEEEIGIFNAIYEMIEEKRKELIEGQVDIFKKESAEFMEKEPQKEGEKGGQMEFREIPEMDENEEIHEITAPQPEEKAQMTIEEGEKKVEAWKKERKSVKIAVKMLSNKAFVGLDGHYYYPEKGDILNLDERVAKILIEGGYAERVESR